MSAESGIIGGGPIGLVTLESLLDEYQAVYKSELQGVSTLNQLKECHQPIDEEIKRIAKKIFVYSFLKTLNTIVPFEKIAVLGRGYSLPRMIESVELKTVSRINTGIVKIPDLGCCVVDLASTFGTCFETIHGRKIDPITSGHTLKIIPLYLIKSMRIRGTYLSWNIPLDSIPEEIKASPDIVKEDYYEKIEQLFSIIKEQSTKYLASLKLEEERKKRIGEEVSSIIEFNKGFIRDQIENRPYVDIGNIRSV